MGLTEENLRTLLVGITCNHMNFHALINCIGKKNHVNVLNDLSFGIRES
jgi:hypothetical protein